MVDRDIHGAGIAISTEPQLDLLIDAERLLTEALKKELAKEKPDLSLCHIIINAQIDLNLFLGND